jgi:hypothetical protein
MKKSNFKKVTIIISVVFMVGFATYAMADRGFGYHMGSGYGNQMGYGGHMGEYGNHMGYGGNMGGYGNHMGYSRNGGHMWNDLSTADRNKMTENMDKLYNKSKDVRSKLYQKSLDLRKELSKENSSKSKALKLQRVISSLESKFDEFRLDHMIEMKKQFPKYFNGYNR